MLRRIYLASFAFAFTVALTAYVNSAFGAGIVGEASVGLLYAMASAVTLACLALLPRAIRALGARQTMLCLLLVIAAAAACFSIGGIGHTALLATFIIFLTATTLSYCVFDILVEHFSTDSATGRIRGLYLTILNASWVVAPFLASRILDAWGFAGLYGIAAFTVAGSLLAIYVGTQGYQDRPYQLGSLQKTLADLTARRPVLGATLLNFTLQFFYAVMVVYVVMFMTDVHGLDFSAIGLILVAMLLPFVLIQYPLGRRIDRGLSARMVVLAGVLIMAVSTFWFGRIGAGSAVLLAAALFCTRIGAASVEAANEITFFKHVTDRDTHLLSFYRNMSPLAYLLAPLGATAFLSFGGIQHLFTALSFCLLASLFAITLFPHEKKT